MKQKVPLYDEFSENYDVMVSWEERLVREQPFFERLFRRNAARDVLDVGCATGGHALRFAEMGLRAVGADPSAAMVRKAEIRASGRLDTSFVQAGFGQLRRGVTGTFDVVTCLGNTLPHALTRQRLDRALADMGSMLRPRGLLAIQQLNYDKILAERRRFLGVSSGLRGETECLFFRFYDLEATRLTFNMVTFEKRASGWAFTSDSTRLRAITQGELAAALAAAGFGTVEWFGNLAGDPFDPGSAGDLVAIAERS